MVYELISALLQVCSGAPGAVRCSLHLEAQDGLCLLEAHVTARSCAIEQRLWCQMQDAILLDT